MSHVQLHTNLDEAQPYVRLQRWQGPVPSVGQEVEFRLDAGPKVFRLRVVSVVWSSDGLIARVELHVPAAPHRTIREWCDWFKEWERAER